MTKTVWTEESTALLKQLWSEGKSQSECAEIIGCVSRNAIAGKVSRLALMREPKEKAPKPTPAPKVAKPVIKRIGVQFRPRKEPVVTVELPLAGKVSLVDLEHRHCRFPINQVEGEWMFCGDDRKPGKPYCPSHCQLTLIPPPKAKERPYFYGEAL